MKSQVASLWDLDGERTGSGLCPRRTTSKDSTLGRRGVSLKLCDSSWDWIVLPNTECWLGPPLVRRPSRLALRFGGSLMSGDGSSPVGSVVVTGVSGLCS